MRVLFALCLAGAQALCLPDGVNESQREFTDGASIGLLAGDWPSSQLLTELLRLILTEGLGLHAHVHPVATSNGVNAIYALGGCMDFNALHVTEKRCDENATEIHVSLETWLGSYSNLMEDFQREHPTLSPEDLGSIGFAGEETIYVSKLVMDAAFEDSGTALDYYKGYNTTHFEPQKYFDSPDAVPKEELQQCNATYFASPSMINPYVEFSGDYEGVELRPDGYVAKCLDGYWWATPACRRAASCLPVLTGGSSWRLQGIMSWTSAYGFPAVVAVSKVWSQHARALKTLFYWWVPDATFIDMRPKEVTFPRHSPAAWARGDQRTSAAGSYIAKLVSNGFPEQSPKVTEFLRKFTLELQEVQDLLLEGLTGSAYEVSCRWARANEKRWRDWVPVDTRCLAGFGLVDGEGRAVERRAEAAGCGVCPAGTASTLLQEEEVSLGRTYWCQPCAPGSAQPSTFSTSCEPCPKGTKTTATGSDSCSPCDEGWYQNSTGSVHCLRCGALRSTRLLGAAEASDCVCNEGLIEVDMTCLPCPEGLHCPKGSTLQGLQENREAVSSQPRLLLDYFSQADRPLHIYRCLGGCPGGMPGVCASGRQGLVCGECAADLYLDKECWPCTSAILPHVAWSGCVVYVLTVICAYYVIGTSYKAKANLIFGLEIASGIAFTTCQNLGVLSMLPLEWPTSVSSLVTFTALFTFDLESLGGNCLAQGMRKYLATSCLVMAAVLILPVLGGLSHLVPCLRRRGLAWQWKKTLSLMGGFLQAAFLTMASLGMVPFMCYQHPNGEFSLLKYPNIFCGSSEHGTMSVVGSILVIFLVVFFAIILTGVVMAPSLTDTRLDMLRFCIHRFRPDRWWFGLIILARGLLVSLPAVISDSANFVVLLIFAVQLIYLILALWWSPWKAAVLNFMDGLLSSLLVFVLAATLESLEKGATQSMRVVAMYGLILIAFGLVLLLALALLSSLGPQLLNLQQLPKIEEAISNLKEVSYFVTSDREEVLHEALKELSSYDFNHILKGISILSDQLQLSVSLSASARITQRSGVSVRPTAKLPQPPEPPAPSSESEAVVKTAL